MTDRYNEQINELCEALLLLSTREEACNFLRDLCTPQEIRTLSERWQVCKLLEQDNLSYRQIHKITGVSLTTIGRVARFLRHEPSQGYKSLLSKLKKTK